MKNTKPISKRNDYVVRKKKTLIGLIFKSNSSGAVYYWECGKDTAEVIISSPGRIKGLKIPFSLSILRMREESRTFETGIPVWEIVKEIKVRAK